MGRYTFQGGVIWDDHLRRPVLTDMYDTDPNHATLPKSENTRLISKLLNDDYRAYLREMWEYALH